jgi:hypothetical protein
MKQTPFNVWETQRFFQENNSFPEMSEADKKYFTEFAEAQVSDSIEDYERYSYNHGGLRKEAKDLLKIIEQDEAMVKALREVEK